MKGEKERTEGRASVHVCVTIMSKQTFQVYNQYARLSDSGGPRHIRLVCPVMSGLTKSPRDYTRLTSERD